MNRLLNRRMLAAALALSLAGCATDPGVGERSFEGSSEPSVDTGAIIGEVSAPRERARIHTELAVAYFERGNMGVALEELRVALAADSSYAPAYNVLGLVHMDLKEMDLAQNNFDRALRIAPNDPDLNHNYGWFLCQTGREEQSLRYFLAAVKNPLYPTPQKSYAVAGSCALRKNMDSDAVDYFQRALRLDAAYPPALVNLANLRYRRGELMEARELIGRFNKLLDATAESLWLALRIERKLGDKAAENHYATQLRRGFAGSREYQNLVKGMYE
ncbi:MAG: type IV pilus biogenesis/stability protein PilW [Betaproteobacteria bacterium]|nr:type IV pilus biogenesis/stability protein PilW [Betaproteobacteria bacterium]